MVCVLSTATHENSAAIYSLRETSNLLSTYSCGGITPNTARKPGYAQTRLLVPKHLTFPSVLAKQSRCSTRYGEYMAPPDTSISRGFGYTYTNRQRCPYPDIYNLLLLTIWYEHRHTALYPTMLFFNYSPNFSVGVKVTSYLTALGWLIWASDVCR